MGTPCGFPHAPSRPAAGSGSRAPATCRASAPERSATRATPHAAPQPPKVPGGSSAQPSTVSLRANEASPSRPSHAPSRSISCGGPPRSPRPAGRARRSGGGRGTGGRQHLEEDLARAAGRLPAAGAGVARRALGEPGALVEAARIARLGAPSSAPSLRTSARRSGLAGADLAQPHRGRTATRHCDGSTHSSSTPALLASPPASAPPAQRNAPARRARRDRGVPRSR